MGQGEKGRLGSRGGNGVDIRIRKLEIRPRNMAEAREDIAKLLPGVLAGRRAHQLDAGVAQQNAK